MSAPAQGVVGALQRAGGLCDLGRFEEAAALLRQTIASQPQEPHAWSLLSAAELGAGNHAPALEAAERAIALDPEAEWPHRLASIALKRLGRIGESVEHAREAVRIEPSSWPALTTLARALAADGSDLPQAREVAARAVALAPNDVETHLTAGLVAAAANARQDAEAAFQRALALDPDNSAAHNELARLRMGGRVHTSPAGLADAARGFASSVRANPHGRTGRRNLEHVLRVFLAKASYLIFLDAYLTARLGSGSAGAGARLLPVALLLVPAGYAWRFVSRLEPSLRLALVRLVTRERKICLAVSLVTVSVVCLLAAAFAPESARGLLAGLAAICALIGRLLLWDQVRQRPRSAAG